MQRSLHVVDFVGGRRERAPGGMGGYEFDRKVGLDGMGKRFFFLFSLVLTHREH